MTALSMVLLFLGSAVIAAVAYYLVTDLAAESRDHDSPDAGASEGDQRNFKH